MMDTFQVVSFAPLIAAISWSAIVDLRSRRIPNWLTLPLLVAGLAGAGMGYLPITFGQSWAGLGIGFAMAFAVFALNAMGGGDVKLMAAIGAWVGPLLVFEVFAAAAIFGMIIVVAQSAASGRLGELFRGTAALAARAAATRDLSCPAELADETTSGRKPLPFAVPALAGTLLVLLATAWRWL